MLGNQGYGPYGTRRYQQGTLGTAKGFTGQYADDLSGLDYYVSRYYDPVIGRFLSADTAQGNLVGMDAYGYVNANPEMKNDPAGRFYTDANGDVGYVYKQGSHSVVSTYTEQTQTYTNYYPEYKYTYSHSAHSTPAYRGGGGLSIRTAINQTFHNKRTVRVLNLMLNSVVW